MENFVIGIKGDEVIKMKVRHYLRTSIGILNLITLVSLK